MLASTDMPRNVSACWAVADIQSSDGFRRRRVSTDDRMRCQWSERSVCFCQVKLTEISTQIALRWYPGRVEIMHLNRVLIACVAGVTEL